MLSVKLRAHLTDFTFSRYELSISSNDKSQLSQLDNNTVPDKVVKLILPDIEPTKAMVAAIEDGAKVCINLFSLSVFSSRISLSSR